MTTNMIEYKKNEIANFIGRPVRTIKHWTDIGLVGAEGMPARGRGYVRTYTERNLIEFAMVDFMSTNLTLSLDVIAGAIDHLRDAVDLTDPNFGKQFELYYCYQVKRIEKDGWNAFSLEVKGGRFDKASIGKGLDEWVNSKEISGFMMLKLGQIRNKAMEKHQLNLLDGTNKW